jgi:hypothetical protein
MSDVTSIPLQIDFGDSAADPISGSRFSVCAVQANSSPPRAQPTSNALSVLGLTQKQETSGLTDFESLSVTSASVHTERPAFNRSAVVRWSGINSPLRFSFTRRVVMALSVRPISR